MFEEIVIFLLSVLLAIVIGALCYAGYKAATAESISLPKNEWRCDDMRQGAPTMVMVGKVLVPVRNEQCYRWVRVGT